MSKSIKPICLIIGLALACVGPALRADVIPAPVAVPAGGVPLLASDWQSEMARRWKGDAAFGSITPSESGARLTTLQRPEHVYSLQAQMLNQAAVRKGDVVLIRFAARSLKAEAATGATRLAVGLGKASPPWTRAYQSLLGLSGSWQRYDMAFECPIDLAVSEAQFTMTFGYTPQEAEIADVSVLNYGTAVPLSALPKTRRVAFDPPVEIYDREIKRIADLRARLDGVTDPSPAHGKVIHVEVSGKPTGSGEAASPLATIPQALARAVPGDTVLVGPGEYREPHGIKVRRSGTPDAWIKIKAAPGGRPKIVTSDWSGFELRGGIAYVEIDGFELEWVKDPAITAHGCGIAPMYATHHIRILNNVIHDYGTGGICSLDCDYLHVEGNVVYHTAHTSPYGGSGISLCRGYNFDDAPGYHNVVRRNVCYDNENTVNVLASSGGNGHTLTDGNGIIIDVLKRSRKNPLIPHGQDRDGPIEPYRGRTLVENNLCFDNGGRGVHIFRSEKIDVINNTCYMNQKTPDINGGEFTAIESESVVIANNIGFSRPGKRVCGQDGSTGFIIWTHDLLFGEEALENVGGLTDVDPAFVAPAKNAAPTKFRLQKSSPAVAKGLASIAPRDDLDGQPRKASAIDLGAFQLSK